VHLLAIAAVGLEPRKAHWLARPDAWESFGYRATDAPNVTDKDTQRLAQADELTRTMLEPAYAALDEQEAEALLNGLTEMTSLLPTPELPE
jgi:hypothetical protein